MILVKPSYEIMQCPSVEVLQFIERCGRTCYKSECAISDKSAPRFVNKIVHDLKHESVIEHASITVRFVIDRGVSHELVRHRLCAFSQESTRYCNYGKSGKVKFVIPPWVPLLPGEYDNLSLPDLADPDEAGLICSWMEAMLLAERHYLELIQGGWKPQQARSVLPNSLKTEIVTTANLREWRHIFKLRTSKAAHPQIREVMAPLCHELQRSIPVIFDDIEPCDE